MPSWKQIAAKPAGSVPANLATRAIVILTAVLVVILVISIAIGGGRGDDAPDPTEALVEQGTLDADVEERLAAQIEGQQRQWGFERQQATLDAERQAIRESNLTLLDEPAPRQPSLDPLTGDLVPPEEADLRLKLRLEALERQHSSLRTTPVAHSVRDKPASILDAALDPTASPQDRLSNTLDTLVSLAAADQHPAAVAAPAPLQSAGGLLDVPLPDSNDLPSYDQPAHVAAPDDPSGSHRIYEGSLVEAVLVTQLSGDYPSPVIAQVAVPFYSGDRQIVLIPRGSRFIGTAQAVRDKDQTRLAVGFHRLLFPDGRWAALRFQGLNQLGEGALKDQVDRHYLSTFLAAGGVGLLSGLAHAGANPYGGTAQFAQIGVAQSFAETGNQIMDRFLNRLPTITIRAGHRMRVWFTADLLVPPTTQGATK